MMTSKSPLNQFLILRSKHCGCSLELGKILKAFREIFQYRVIVPVFYHTRHFMHKRFSCSTRRQDEQFLTPMNDFLMYCTDGLRDIVDRQSTPILLPHAHSLENVELAPPLAPQQAKPPL